MTAPTYKYVDKLQGKHILIFSGGSGFGFAVAEAAIEHSVNIIISGSNTEKLQRAAQRLYPSYPDINERQLITAACNLAEFDTLSTRLEALLHKATNNGTTKSIILSSQPTMHIMSLASQTSNLTTYICLSASGAFHPPSWPGCYPEPTISPAHWKHPSPSQMAQAAISQFKGGRSLQWLLQPLKV